MVGDNILSKITPGAFRPSSLEEVKELTEYYLTRAIKQGFKEHPEPNTAIYFLKSGVRFASGYQRLVVDANGAFVEVATDQMVYLFKNRPLDLSKYPYAIYSKHLGPDKEEVELQLRVVSYSSWKVNMYYILTDDVMIIPR